MLALGGLDANERRRVVVGGALAGAIGGVAVSVFLFIATSAVGTSPWICVNLAAVPVLGAKAMRPWFEAGPFVVGQLCHLGISALWGMVFAALVIGMRPIAVIAAGLVWGVFVRAVMFGYVLPTLRLSMLARSLPGPLVRPWHLIFGAVLGIAFAIAQRHRTRTGPLRGFLPVWLARGN